MVQAALVNCLYPTCSASSILRSAAFYKRGCQEKTPFPSLEKKWFFDIQPLWFLAEGDDPQSANRFHRVRPSVSIPKWSGRDQIRVDDPRWGTWGVRGSNPPIISMVLPALR